MIREKLQKEIDETCRDASGRISREHVTALLNLRLADLPIQERAVMWWSMHGQLVYNPKYDLVTKMKNEQFNRELAMAVDGNV